MLRSCMASFRSNGTLLNEELMPTQNPKSFACSSRHGVEEMGRYENIPLADMWQDIQGAHSWNGLLGPINPVLKDEILRYGDLAELCYDAFDSELSMNDHGGCKYRPDKLFESCEMAGDSQYSNGYKVTKYLYADTDILGKKRERSVWIGFIAVCTDAQEIRRLGRRDIVVAWRGTQTAEEWIEDARDILVPARLSITRFKHKSVRAGLSTTAPFNDNGVRVEEGFLSCYISHGENSKSARDTVISENLRRVDEYKEESLSVTLTGHSLGAALATLSSYDVKENLNANLPAQPIPVTVFTFASPRVGNRAFALRMEELGVKVLRLVNKNDIVPKVPGLVFNENSCRWLSKMLDWLPWTYFHVGVKIVLNNNDSPILKELHNLDPAYAHSLKNYLHLIDGYVGEGKPFKSSGKRDPAPPAATSY